MEIKISVVIPVYNVEKYLPECIESVRNQTYPVYEIILVDDGSTDSSSLICDKYVQTDKRIRVVHKKNEGLSSARNTGIDAASGDYISFIDGDDWIEPGMYKAMTDAVIESKADIIACNMILELSTGDKVPYASESKNILYTKEKALKELYKNKNLTFSACNKIYNIKLFDSIRFTENIILEDMDISYRLIYQANSIYYLKDPFYNYRYNESSILRARFTLKRLDEYEVKKRMYNFYFEKFQSISDVAYYFCVFYTGCYLYNLTYKNFPEKINEYQYLIDFDRDLLKRLIFEKYEESISLKNKVCIILYLCVPKTYLYLKRKFLPS